MSDMLDAFDADLSDVSVPPSEVDPVEAPAAETGAQEQEAAAPADSQAPAAEETSDHAKEAAAKALAAAAGKTEAALAGDAAKPAVKQLTFTADGKPVQLVENAEIDWKVDGKPEKVKVRDLLDNWSGKTSYDRKFQELANQRKGFQEESAKFEQSRSRQKALVTDMHKAASEGRVFDAVTNLLEMTGLDKQVNSKEYVRQLRDALAKEAEVIRGLSPEQRQLREEKEEREHLEAKYKRTIQQREQEQADRAFHERVTKVIDAAGGTPEEFVRTRDFLIGKFKEANRPMSELTPEFIGEQMRNVRDYSVVKEAIDAVDPELFEKNLALSEQMVLLMRANPSWTKNDVKDIIQKAVGEKRSAAVSSKLAKSPVATAAKAAVKSKVVVSSGEIDDPTKAKYTRDDLSW